jgi:class 3 adenylate cyclase
METETPSLGIPPDPAPVEPCSPEAEPFRSTRPRTAARAARCFVTTALFVDIVDSTRRAVELGDDQWLDLQEAHETMLRRELAAFGGRYVRSLGDGVLAVFDSVAAAVTCAALVADTSRAFGIEIRAGLHSGDCQRRGRRLGGLLFHVGARVVSRAGAGEVLVSRVVKELVADPSFVFVPRGTHRLKGLPGTWPLFAVAAAPSRDGGLRLPV